jgi:hypothetical protein
MKLGEIEIRQSSKFLPQLASFMAFASSVQGYTSNLKAINRIGQQLGDFVTGHKSVLQVSAPLLGAGAGGLGSQRHVQPNEQLADFGPSSVRVCG